MYKQHVVYTVNSYGKVKIFAIVDNEIAAREWVESQHIEESIEILPRAHASAKAWLAALDRVTPTDTGFYDDSGYEFVVENSPVGLIFYDTATDVENDKVYYGSVNYITDYVKAGLTPYKVGTVED